MRILFLGDSITDAGRDKRNYFHLGKGYAAHTAGLLTQNHPDLPLEFINLGINGNRSDQVFARLYKDAIELQPDIIVLLLGVNDVWHRYALSKVMTTDEQFTLNYRIILQKLREMTSAKILMMEPYLLDDPAKQELWGEELSRIQVIIRELAREFADDFVPLQTLFTQALPSQPEERYYSADGVHPNANGAAFIGDHCAAALEKLL